MSNCRLCVLCFCAIAALTGAKGETTQLLYRPVDVEYSKQLDRIVMVSANPDQLHIYDPVRRTESAINLARTPVSVTMSPSGLYAAVGHSATISWVNLTSGGVEKTFSPASIPGVTNIGPIAVGADFVYVSSSALFSIRISTGVATLVATPSSSDDIALHPAGRSNC